MYRCNEPLFDLSHGRCTVFLTDNNGGDPLFPVRYTGSISFDQVMHRPHEKALKLRLVVALDEEEAAPEKEI